jgi:hypothetical protein
MYFLACHPQQFAQYRALTGQLSWAAENTWPDLAFDARSLSTKNKEATYKDLHEANKVLKKAQLEKNVTLKFPKLGKLEDLKIVAFTDSSYGSMSPGREFAAKVV